MIEDKYLTLIHGEIDSANSPEESAKLKAYLANHPEARQLYDELTSTSAMLDEVKPVEPPPHLQHAIVAALSLRRASVRERHDFWGAVSARLAAILRPAHAFAFAGGVVAGVILLALLSPAVLRDGVGDWSQLYGTMGASRAAQEMAGEQRWDLKRPEFAATLSMKSAGESIILDLKLDSPQPLEVVFSFDENALGFNSFVRLEKTGALEMAAHLDSVSLTHFGRQNYALVFTRRTRASPAMHFRILCNGELVYEQALVGSL